MHTANAMAIYGTEKVTTARAYDMGLLFFQIIGLAITNSGYYKYRKDRSDEDFDFIESSLLDLRGEIEANSATSFRLYSESKSGDLWEASFGYSTTDFGGFCHIDAQGMPPNLGGKEFLEFIDSFCKHESLSYAIFYSTNDVSEGLYYAEGENLVNIYKHENSILFSRETGGRFKGAERYKDAMLRMVYPVNLINEKHLNLQVGDCNLRQWILSNNQHGTLKSTAHKMWIWEVEDKKLEQVNNELGEAGLLISWKSSRSSRSAKLLP
jgi:hypothetical protein